MRGRPDSLLGAIVPPALLVVFFVTLAWTCARPAKGADLDRTALAAMLRVAEPGITESSRVELTCSAPEAVQDFQRGRVSYPGWSRVESRAEGMDRWAVIARAIARVSEEPPSNWRRAWPRLGLARALVTIARHESAFWRPVHDGRLRGTAGEVCLVQVHPVAAKTLGVELESLVGLDAAATERCLRAGAELLARARRYCELWPDPWFMPAITLYATGDDCNPERFAALVDPRWKTWLLTADRKPLPAIAELALAMGAP